MSRSPVQHLTTQDSSRSRVQHFTTEPYRTPTPAVQVTCPCHVSNTLPPRHAGLPPRLSKSRVKHCTTEPRRTSTWLGLGLVSNTTKPCMTPTPDVHVMCPTPYHRDTQDSDPGCPGHVSNTLPPRHAGLLSRLSRSCVKHITTETRRTSTPAVRVTCPTPYHRAMQDSHPSCPGHVSNTLPPRHAGLPPRLSRSHVKHFTTEPRRTSIPAVRGTCPTRYHRDTQDSHPGSPGHVSHTLPQRYAGSHPGCPGHVSNTLPTNHAGLPTRLSGSRVKYFTTEPRRTSTWLGPGFVSNTLPLSHAGFPPRMSRSRV